LKLLQRKLLLNMALALCPAADQSTQHSAFFWMLGWCALHNGEIRYMLASRFFSASNQRVCWVSFHRESGLENYWGHIMLNLYVRLIILCLIISQNSVAVSKDAYHVPSQSSINYIVSRKIRPLLWYTLNS
jgi:hypothetical protein